MEVPSSNSKEENETPSGKRTVTIDSGQIDSRELFQSERELKIRHGSEIYRLRRTGLNKLILTK